MLIDTHCHLDAAEFDSDRDAILVAARAGGVGKIVVPAVHADNFDAVYTLSLANEPSQGKPGNTNDAWRGVSLLPAYGIHPLHSDRADETDLYVLRETLRRLAQTPFRAIAVGEIGLDFFFHGHDAACQAHFFTEQLNIAREFDLPVLLHVRRAIDVVLKYLRRAGKITGIVHAFNGSFQQAEHFIRLGFGLGFGGAMTYPGSKHLRKLAATLPIEHIVLESDAPDIPPVWLHGKRNSPAEVPRFAEELAVLRGCPMEEIARQTTKNALGFLRLDAPSFL